MSRARDDILGELAREEARLDDLERTRTEARARIASLRSELEIAAPPSVPVSMRLPLTTNGQAPQTPADKVKLFRSLFRGRRPTSSQLGSSATTRRLRLRGPGCHLAERRRSPSPDRSPQR